MPGPQTQQAAVEQARLQQRLSVTDESIHMPGTSRPVTTVNTPAVAGQPTGVASGPAPRTAVARPASAGRGAGEVPPALPSAPSGTGRPVLDNYVLKDVTPPPVNPNAHLVPSRRSGGAATRVGAQQTTPGVQPTSASPGSEAPVGAGAKRQRSGAVGNISGRAGAQTRAAARQRVAGLAPRGPINRTAAKVSEAFKSLSDTVSKGSVGGEAATLRRMEQSANAHLKAVDSHMEQLFPEKGVGEGSLGWKATKDRLEKLEAKNATAAESGKALSAKEADELEVLRSNYDDMLNSESSPIRSHHADMAESRRVLEEVKARRQALRADADASLGRAPINRAPVGEAAPKGGNKGAWYDRAMEWAREHPVPAVVTGVGGGALLGGMMFGGGGRNG